jgi:hypothetical protein
MNWLDEPLLSTLIVFGIIGALIIGSWIQTRKYRMATRIRRGRHYQGDKDHEGNNH